MEISNNNEINFIFKINKITYLLNNIDVYYQKEILKDIKRYNINITNNLMNIENPEERKKTMYVYLNKYLDGIINDHLDYLIESYHKENKHNIFIQAEKNALQSIQNANKENVNKNIHSSVDNLKSNFYNNVSIESNSNNQLNNVLNEKINDFFDKIKIELFNNIELLIDKKIENSFFNTDESSKHIQRKIKEFLKIFLKDDNIYTDIVEQMNNEINNMYNILKNFQKDQTDLQSLIEKYLINNENKINSIETKIINKVNDTFENKIKLLTNIFNDSIQSTLKNVKANIDEQQIIRNVESKMIQNSNFSKNNLEIKFDKENNEIQLYYYNELIDCAKLNIKGLIGPKGPQGLKGEKGDISIIRNIQINPDETIKFTMQNGTSIYEVNTENKIPKGPKGDQGISGEKGEPGNININLNWNQENVMRMNKENPNNLMFLKSLSVGENGHCLENNSLSIGESVCYKENSLVIGKNSKTFNENSIAFFGNTLGKNSFSYMAEDVEENCVKFGSNENKKFNIENIHLKAKEIVLDCDDLILKINNFKNNKIFELEEKINLLTKEIHLLKHND